jgi:hypothetical protein
MYGNKNMKMNPIFQCDYLVLAKKDVCLPMAIVLYLFVFSIHKMSTMFESEYKYKIDGPFKFYDGVKYETKNGHD